MSRPEVVSPATTNATARPTVRMLAMKRIVRTWIVPMVSCAPAASNVFPIHGNATASQTAPTEVTKRSVRHAVRRAKCTASITACVSRRSGCVMVKWTVRTEVMNPDVLPPPPPARVTASNVTAPSSVSPTLGAVTVPTTVLTAVMRVNAESVRVPSSNARVLGAVSRESGVATENRTVWMLATRQTASPTAFRISSSVTCLARAFRDPDAVTDPKTVQMDQTRLAAPRSVRIPTVFDVKHPRPAYQIPGCAIMRQIVTTEVTKPVAAVKMMNFVVMTAAVFRCLGGVTVTSIVLMETTS